MPDSKYVLFVCEHGAAKSVVAAAYFNRLAAEAGLSAVGLARGTHPDPELSPQALAGLQSDGLAPTEALPRELSSTEVAAAFRIVAFCDLPLEDAATTRPEFWRDMPPVSTDYHAARDAILARVRRLVDDLRDEID